MTVSSSHSLFRILASFPCLKSTCPRRIWPVPLSLAQPMQSAWNEEVLAPSFKITMYEAFKRKGSSLLQSARASRLCVIDLLGNCTFTKLGKAQNCVYMTLLPPRLRFLICIAYCKVQLDSSRTIVKQIDKTMRWHEGISCKCLVLTDSPSKFLSQVTCVWNDVHMDCSTSSLQGKQFPQC